MRCLRYSGAVTFESTPAPWLALVSSDALAMLVLPALEALSIRVRRVGVSTELVQGSATDAPGAIVREVGSPLAELPPWDVPVLWVGPAGDACGEPPMPAGNDSVARHWLPHPRHMTVDDWRQAMDFATAVHRREQAQRALIDRLQAQLADQRVVARAKGLLMATQGLTEEDAFGLLRAGAMHTRLPLAAVARTVVDAATWSEAVNRAGQLRWLSQRCVAAAAQRLTRIDPPAARRIQNEALKRAREILQDLARLPLTDATRQDLDEAEAAWRDLTACLDRRLDLVSLAHADVAAEQALARAEALTAALQSAGTGSIVGVVNTCGRQRMRTQRVMKLGLLMNLGVESAHAGGEGSVALASRLVAEFAGTLSELSALPLSSPAIDAARERVATRWSDMTKALQSGDVAALVQGGEDLLVSVDELTLCWQRSLQLVLV